MYRFPSGATVCHLAPSVPLFVVFGCRESKSLASGHFVSSCLCLKNEAIFLHNRNIMNRN